MPLINNDNKYAGMSVKTISGFYKNVHENDGWSINGYKIPTETKFNQS